MKYEDWQKQKQEVKEKAERRNMMAHLPRPNRGDYRRKSRTLRTDESPYTKPSREKRRKTNRIKNRVARKARVKNR